jgi:Ca2+/H+ antiporter
VAAIHRPLGGFDLQLNLTLALPRQPHLALGLGLLMGLGLLLSLGLLLGLSLSLGALRHHRRRRGQRGNGHWAR